MEEGCPGVLCTPHSDPFEGIAVQSAPHPICTFSGKLGNLCLTNVVLSL